MIKYRNYPLDKRGKLNVHKTFRGHPTRLLNVFCTFSLSPVWVNIPWSRNTLKQLENHWINAKKQLQVGITQHGRDQSIYNHTITYK